MFLHFEFQTVVIVFVNLFFIWRVWMISRKIWVVLLLSIEELMTDQFSLTITRVVLGSVSPMLAYINATWESYQNDSNVLLGVAMGLAALEDTAIASTLACYLYSKRTPSMFSIIELISYTQTQHYCHLIYANIRGGNMW
ncbi:hypothetical protein J3A83DRAFT_4185278 [Scleroderma citrinum]